MWLSDDADVRHGLEVTPAYTTLPPNRIPTLSQWGLIILGLLVLTIGTVFILRRRAPVPVTAEPA